MAVTAKFPTKRLECFPKAKELRMGHYQRMLTAREEGKLFVIGSQATHYALLAGLGDYVFMGGTVYGASVAPDNEFAVRCQEAVDAKGYARDLCAYMRNHWGSMFLNEFAFAEGRPPFPRPDFCFTRVACDVGQAKWYKTVADHFGVPLIAYDQPAGAGLNGKPEQRIEWLAAQFHDCIEQMEKISGRKYDDEKMIAALRTQFEVQRLWGEMQLLNRAIPAPLDVKVMQSFLPITILRRPEKSALEFYKMLRDEVKERIASGIAACPVERCRLGQDSDAADDPAQAA